ncbi:MAG: CHASE3 domain-containing protein [Caulobacteraceae bacterium]
MGANRVIAAALTVVLLGLTALFVQSHFGGEARARYWVAHTHRVIEQNQAVFLLVEQAESSERGYLLTQDRRYLAPFAGALAKIPRAEASLATMVSDNPAQAGRVRGLEDVISRRADLLTRCVVQASAGDFAGARERSRLGKGLAMMTAIDARSSAVSRVEQDLLRQRLAAAARSEEMNLAIGLAVAAAALAGLLGSVFSLTRANRRLSAAMAAADVATSARDATQALTDALFAHTPDYLYVLEIRDNDRFVVGEINPAFEKALGVRASDVKGRAIDEMMSRRDAEPLLAHYRRVRSAERPVLTRDVIPGLHDGPRTWESILVPVKNADGVADRIIGSTRDITERVKTEERLREAQRMEAVGQLTGGVAHDFNNLLQVIRGNLELLEGAAAGDPRAERSLRNAIHGADRAAQLTRQLLAFARRQPLTPQVINLSRLVGEMAELLRRTLGETVQVETVIAGGLWNTIADPAQVESAILNLALNARDAMPGGGRLTIEVANAALDEAYVREAGDVTPGQYVLVAVSDTGSGIAGEVKKRVFDPFFTTKAEGKGSGLGLSMVYGFVRQSSGHIRIYSEPDQGTTVKIYLPRSRQPAARMAEAESAGPEGADQCILVVEDEAGVRAAAVGMLEQLGYRCLEAEDAKSALAILEANPNVDLVFTDVVMPGPVTCRQMIGSIGTLRPGLPILFTSGYTENAIVHHGRLDEGVSLLSKPYARDDLASKVATLLRPRPSA